ncbi:MAG: TetR/AcrR family transcriptional regulator [Candidatus Dormibacteria bacterium]
MSTLKGQRQLAPWLSEATIQAVGRATDKGHGEDKKRRLRQRDRRELLLQACLQAFARDGLDMTTMDSIALAAGVSKPLVYRHFHNRHEALLAVVDRESQRLLEQLGIAGSTPGRTFEELSSAFLHFAAESAGSFRLLFQLVDAAAGAAKRRVDQLRERVGGAMVSSLLRDSEPATGTDDLGQAWLGGVVSSIMIGVAGGMARGEDPALRAVALRRLLRPEGVQAALADFRRLRASPVGLSGTAE